jgi:hypothetical protein
LQDTDGGIRSALLSACVRSSPAPTASQTGKRSSGPCRQSLNRKRLAPYRMWKRIVFGIRRRRIYPAGGASEFLQSHQEQVKAEIFLASVVIRSEGEKN